MRKMLRLVPVTLKEANAFVLKLHRHHDPVSGHRWSVGVSTLHGKLVGVAICERSKARMESPFMCEVTRVCTDGTSNACSMLYAACARAAEAMGYDEIKTFIFASEPGTSLKAAGWQPDGQVEPENWSRPSRKRKITKHSQESKVRYVKFVGSWKILPALGVERR
jgi:hypothetical protein